MGEEGVLTLKSVEPALARFNEEAVPHHIRLLRTHHQRIREFSEVGDWSRVKAEQTNARRVAGQLRALLDDLAQLRHRVRLSDRAAFDSRTASARDQTKRALKLCLEVAAVGCATLARATASVSSPPTHRCTTLKNDIASEEIPEPTEHTENSLKEKRAEQVLEVRASELESKEAVLAGWRGLQAEVALVAEAWRTLAVAARVQREPVVVAAQSVERAGEEVGLARKALAQAARWGTVSTCAVGAAAGALVGGPLGLLVGAKAGAASAIAGSLLGYKGASAITRRAQIDCDQITAKKHSD